MRDPSFIEELLKEEEQKELQLTEAHYDLMILEIAKLEKEIGYNFQEAEKEVEIIRNWALNKNSRLNDKIEFLKTKLESFLRERNERTLDLPNGLIKIRKKPDRVEVKDMELFLQNARSEMLRLVPESYKPDINSIKKYIKMSGGKVPQGVEYLEGEESFTLTIKTKEVENGTAN
ncbi:hypothetical protein ASZ90_004235 [hydrocarbon metagenome]|uniref:Uncharacterized protein n=1 Tax=hydrocarbon metagenome TaxID=938273 RepID=A0A0W8FYL0_9ZZZZ